MTVIYSRRCYRYILIDTFSNSHGMFLRARQRVVSAKHAVWIASSLWLWLFVAPILFDVFHGSFRPTPPYHTHTYTHHYSQHILPFDLFIVPRVDLLFKVLAVFFNALCRCGGKNVVKKKKIKVPALINPSVKLLARVESFFFLTNQYEENWNFDSFHSRNWIFQNETCPFCSTNICI